MNKAWITGLTVAGVVGTGGAALAGMSVTSHDGSAVSAQGIDTEAALGQQAPRSVTYQIGAAGSVNLEVTATSLKVVSALPTTPWTIAGFSEPATHIEVQFTDGTQLVTFSAELVNGEVVVSLNNAGTSPVMQITEVDPSSTTTVPAPQPAVPTVALLPGSGTPSGAHTTSPSKSGDEHESDEHESEHHEDSHESDDHEESSDD